VEESGVDAVGNDAIPKSAEGAVPTSEDPGLLKSGLAVVTLLEATGSGVGGKISDDTAGVVDSEEENDGALETESSATGVGVLIEGSAYVELVVASVAVIESLLGAATGLVSELELLGNSVLLILGVAVASVIGGILALSEKDEVTTGELSADASAIETGTLVLFEISEAGESLGIEVDPVVLL
jgi:hypothetical protein